MQINNTLLQNGEKAVFALRGLYNSYGYAQYKMSKFEEYDFYAKNKDFLISENIITFTDIGGKLLALKPDVTLSIVKNANLAEAEVKKVYYNENVYRVKRGDNSFKEIMQTGLECIGNIDNFCVSEVLELAIKSLAAISDDFILEVSDQSIVLRVIDMLEVSPNAKLKLIKLISEKNTDEINEILVQENADKTASSILNTLVKSYGKPADVLTNLKCISNDLVLNELIDNLASILNSVKSSKIRLDFSEINDVNYYNGIVFKGFINGIPTSVLSGGRYDPLIKKMGYKFSAIGFAVYLDLLSELSKEPEKFDIDAVVLYTEDSDYSVLQEQLNTLRENYQSVSALKTIPKRLKIKKLYKLSGKGVELIENNA